MIIIILVPKKTLYKHVLHGGILQEPTFQVFTDVLAIMKKKNQNPV